MYFDELVSAFGKSFSRGTQREIPSEQCHLARSGSQSQRKVLFISPAHGASHMKINVTVCHLLVHSHRQETESNTGAHVEEI